jgi:transcription elongation factor Elf1
MSQRDNLERTLGGKPVVPDQGSPAPHQSSGHEFSFVTPTEFVELPSKGQFYDENHPLHQAEVVEIRHMTAKEEDILTSEALLKRGVAVDRMLQSVLVDKQVKVTELLIGDKNALIVASRITGFGPHYETMIGCPACGQNISNAFNLGELELVDHTDVPANVTVNEDGTFNVHLESIDFSVQLKLLTGADESRWSERKDKKKKLKLPDSTVTDQLKLIVVGVEGRTEASVISEFIDVCPTRASREIRSAYEAVMPNVDLNQEFTCPECNHDGRIGVPLTADFFWPDQ